MTIDDFNYDLDKELIAQKPLKKRDESRLMVIDKKTGAIEHKKFYDILDYLNEGDVLVLNNTKVLPARIIGLKETTKAIIEILLLKNIENDNWECLVKHAKKIKVGDRIVFGDDDLIAECIEVGDEGIRVLKFIYEGIFYEILDKLGTMPLPPYIHEKLEDKDRYQTVYAKEIGSAAAPTAGLHFTEDLLEKINKKGIDIIYITLHVGLGTFRPVSVENIDEHKMHSEFYQIGKKEAQMLNDAKNANRRIIAVGTTSVRTLETVMSKYGEFKECSGYTDIFIKPGYQFKAIDALITNFHLPKSTLVMLVAAFTSTDMILNAYKIATKEKYRFFSFGDAMFIK